MYIRQVPLPASCAYFFVKCGQSHPEGSARTEEGGFARRSRECKRHIGVQIFRGKSAGNLLNPLNSGFRYFLREGKFRNRARTESINLGRRQRDQRSLDFDIFFELIISVDFSYKKGYIWGVHIFSKGGKHKGGTHSSVIFYCLLPKNERTDFLLRTGMQKQGVPSGDFFENEQTGEKSHVATMLLWEMGGFKYYWGVLKYH